MTAVDAGLTALALQDRQVVEGWLFDFDHQWHTGRLAEAVAKLPPPGSPLRFVALVEMVKIDLERQWQNGRPACIEGYLHAYPEVGTLDTVSADLIAKEYEVRLQSRAAPPLSRFLQRFPGREEHLRPLLERASQSGVVSRPAPRSRDTPSAGIPPDLAQHPKFAVERELGQGGMGVVYLARHKQMDRHVVIKVVNQPLLDQPGALERFRREIRAAAQLAHPNIVTAFDAEQAGQLHLLVMEFVPGRTLAEVLEKRGPLPVAHACHYARQAALGLQHASERGMVHRDIKPQNLMLTPKGQVKILDFGLAKLASERQENTGLTGSNWYIGTPEYSAPEQARDAHAADIRADLYSLGCTLYCLLAGRPPFQEDSTLTTLLAHREKEPRPLPELRPEVTSDLWDVVARLLAKDPDQRYQNPMEAVQALRAFAKPGEKLDAKAVSAPALGLASPGKGTMIATDTSQIEEVVRQVPATPARKKLPARDEASRPAGLADPSRLPGNSTPSGWPWPWLVLACAGILLLTLLGIWGSGVFRVKTQHGTIVLKNLPADAEVLVDGDRVTVTPMEGDSFEVRVIPGKKHWLEVRRTGVKVLGEEVEITAGGSKSFVFRLEPNEPPKGPMPEGTHKPSRRDTPTAHPAAKADTKPPPPRKVFGKTIIRSGVNRVPGNSSWRIEGGDLVQDSLQKSGQSPNIVFGDPGWSNYDLTLRAKWERGTQGPSISFHNTSPADFCAFNIGAYGNIGSEVIALSGGKWGRADDGYKPGAIIKNVWYDIRIEVREDRFRCFLDGEVLFQVREDRFRGLPPGRELLFPRQEMRLTKGRIGLGCWESACRFRDIMVTDPEGTLLWNGLPDLPDGVGIGGDSARITTLTNSLGVELVRVPRRTFWMGDRGKQRPVTIEHDFYIGKYPVTQGQWRAIMGNNPSHFSRRGPGARAVQGFSDEDLKEFPLECVSWSDVQEFLKRLNAQEKTKGLVYRLPTEAEREYACRGAATSPEDCSFDFYFSEPTNELSSDLANFDGTKPAGRAPKGVWLHRTSRVGSYRPNRLGLYDMHGNVWEWCSDPFQPGTSDRVMRGGAWDLAGIGCRASYRLRIAPSTRQPWLGFRIAASPSGVDREPPPAKSGGEKHEESHLNSGAVWSGCQPTTHR